MLKVLITPGERLSFCCSTHVRVLSKFFAWIGAFLERSVTRGTHAKPDTKRTGKCAGTLEPALVRDVANGQGGIGEQIRGPTDPDSRNHFARTHAIHGLERFGEIPRRH